MANSSFIEEIKEKSFLMGSGFMIDSSLKKYPVNMYTAMKTVYESGVLANILAERYCDNKMLGTFIKKLSNENGLSKNDAKDAIVEWVEVCAAVYGLSNRIDLSNSIELSSSKYKPSYNFMPFLDLDKLYDYSLCLNNCKSGKGTVEDIGTVIAILNDYLFTNQELAKTDAGINKINQNKKKALNELEEAVCCLKNNRIIKPFYLISMAQIYLLRGEFEEAISFYEDLLNIREISNPEDMDEDYYCGELENASMIAHNIVCAYTWAGMLGKATQAKTKYKKIFELQKSYNENISNKYCQGNDEKSVRMREYYKKIVDDLCNKDDFAYFDLSIKGHFHGMGSLLPAIIKDCEENNKIRVDMSSMVGIEKTTAGDLIVTDYEYNDGTIFMRLPKCIDGDVESSFDDIDVGEADPNLINKVTEAKYDIEGWSIADCKEIFDLFGDLYLSKCEYSLKDENMTESWMRIHIEDRYLEFTYNRNGVAFATNFSLRDSALEIDTYPSIDKIVINNVVTVFIEDDKDFNFVCLYLKYAQYLYDNNLIGGGNPLDKFEEVTSCNTTEIIKMFTEYFLLDEIEHLKLGAGNVEEWDMNNKVEDENFGDISLFLGINDKQEIHPISYLEAIDKPNNLMLYINVEYAVRYGMGISNGAKLFKNDDNYEIYISNSSDDTEGRNIEFYNEEDYRKALAYLYIGTLQQDFSSFLPADKRRKSVACKPVVETSHIPDKVESSTDKDSPYDRLNGLVGLDAIKSDVNNLVNLMKMQIRRQQQGLKPVPVSLHLVFSGNPGTGKTTIARILADIYKEIGILSKGHLVEVDRSGLVAGYVGQTAIKTQEKIDEALGGILFIDEAYTLAKDGNDYGQEAIDTILKAMEDHRSDFIVIVAGYSDLMHRFINSNPGLKSRFNKYINFPDYTADELIEIFMTMCNEYAYELSEDAKKVMEKKIRNLETNKGENFANARDVRNIFERVITNQASRLAMAGTDDIMKITAEDFD